MEKHIIVFLSIFLINMKIKANIYKHSIITVD